MLTLSLCLLIAQVAATPLAQGQPAERPAVVVEVVDPFWIPLPGIEILVRREDRPEPVARARTSKSGTAEFLLSPGARYSIEARHPGFKNGRVKSFRTVSALSDQATARVQIRLALSGKAIEIQ